MRKCATTLAAEMTVKEQSLLLAIVRGEQFSGPHLEIGTAAGGTLCAMMQCFDDARRPKFVVVDRMTYFPDQLETVSHNLRLHGLDPATVDFRVSDSAVAFRESRRRGDQFDFILLDGCHKVLAVMSDLRWTRLLRPGGVICLHDYGAKFPGVRLSVDRFLSRHSNFVRLARADSLLAIRKTEPALHPEVTPFDRAYALALHLPLMAQRKLNKWRDKRRAA